MKIRRSRLVLAVLLGAWLAVGFCVPAALAHLTDQTGTMVNSFDGLEFAPEDMRVEVQIKKTVINSGADSIGPEDFRFALYDEDAAETIELTTDADGFASALISLVDCQINKTYTYRLSEIDDGRSGVTYSDKIYAIEIRLGVDQEYHIKPELKLDGMPVGEIVAAFENEYTSMALPDTGDHSSLALYAALLLSGSALLILLRRKAHE